MATANGIGLARNSSALTTDKNLRAIAEVSARPRRLRPSADIELDQSPTTSNGPGPAKSSSHYYGVTMLNLAMNSLVQDRLDEALAHATRRLEALEGTTGDIEHSAARALRASILLRLGIEEARGLAAE